MRVGVIGGVGDDDKYVFRNLGISHTHTHTHTHTLNRVQRVPVRCRVCVDVFAVCRLEVLFDTRQPSSLLGTLLLLLSLTSDKIKGS